MRSKSEVLRQEKKEGKTVHLANLMDLCHLKNADPCKTPPKNTTGEWCSGETTSKTKKDTEQNPQSKVPQRLRRQR